MEQESPKKQDQSNQNTLMQPVGKPSLGERVAAMPYIEEHIGKAFIMPITKPSRGLKPSSNGEKK